MLRVKCSVFWVALWVAFSQKGPGSLLCPMYKIWFITPHPKCSSAQCGFAVRSLCEEELSLPRGYVCFGIDPQVCVSLGQCGTLVPPSTLQWNWRRQNLTTQTPSLNNKHDCLTFLRTRLVGEVLAFLNKMTFGFLFDAMTFLNMTEGQISHPWCTSKYQAHLGWASKEENLNCAELR